MTRRPSATAPFVAMLLLPLLGCDVEKSKTPLSPSVAGPIGGVEITAPRLVQPGDGTKLRFTQQPITLIVENSSSNGVRPVTYSFEVASDGGFDNKVYARSGVQPGDGRTTVTMGALDSGRQYFWRVRAEDGANASAYSTAGFEVLPKPQLDPPPQVSPINNEVTGSQRPALVVGTSARNAAIGSLIYEFQIAGDPAFASLVAIGISGESGDRTAWTPGADLNGSTTYFWRVRAIDTDLTSAWSGAQSFRTASISSPSPGPSPGPAPGPAPGGPCNSGDPLKIVECERAKFGHMNDGQLLSFLAAVADSLNRNGIPGGRFGLLVKTSGSNCNGYSCDIICSGNGGGQRQWDVVAGNDAQTAMWHEVDGITTRVCEIR